MTRMQALIAIGLISQSATAEEKLDQQGMLALARVVGACEVMGELFSFQKISQMSGGNDFVLRFVEAEALNGRPLRQS